MTKLQNLIPASANMDVFQIKLALSLLCRLLRKFVLQHFFVYVDMQNVC